MRINFLSVGQIYIYLRIRLFSLRLRGSNRGSRSLFINISLQDVVKTQWKMAPQSRPNFLVILADGEYTVPVGLYIYIYIYIFIYDCKME